MNEVIKKIVEPLLKPGQYLLEVAEDMRGNYVRVIIDSEHTLTLDDTTALTRSIKDSEDMNDSFPQGFRLEVSTPGIDKPLKFPFQYKKNINRELKATISKEGQEIKIKGKIISADNNSVDLVNNGKKISLEYGQIKEANVKVSFN